MANTIGAQLKQTRESRGLSLEQASRAIHIRPHYLEALENDDRDALPSNVQGRGFLRLYADLLNLPVEPLLAAWDGKADVQTITEPVETAQSPGGVIPADKIAAPEPESADLVESSPPDTPIQHQGSDSPESAQAIFREIGQTLRSQRETLGLTLAEVERYTRLRQHYIQALEEGRMDGLPSPVQGKGMLSNYAAFLNLDEEAVLLRFADGLQTRRIERLPRAEPNSLFTTKKRPARQAPFWKRFLTPDLIFGIGLAAIILLFILWTAARIDTERQSQIEPTTPAISEILLTPDEILGQSITRTATEEVENGEGPVIEVTGEGMQVSETAVSQALPADSDETTGDLENDLIVPTATLPPMNNDPLQVYIIARARAWLQVTADGQVSFLGRVVPGNAYAFSGENKVELLTGNAAALQVIYNQNDLGTIGLTGEVVGLVFSSEGIMTPTPAFTATPTQTPVATITPLPSPTAASTPTVTPFIPEN